MEEQGQFHRIELMIGRAGLARLQSAHVMIAGLGAVGSYVVEALARAGIGHFTLVDCDTVKASNINRQLFALWETVGQKKTNVAATRIHSINPSAEIKTIDVLLNAQTLPDVIGAMPPECFLVDAIDSLGPKTDLIAMAVTRNIPLISSMGAALRTDPSLVRIGRLSDVTCCRLSAMLRKRLRRRGISTDDITCVYSPEEVRLTARDKILGPEFSEDERTLPGRRRCVMGSLPTLPAIFGLFIANEVIQILTGLKADAQN